MGETKLSEQSAATAKRLALIKGLTGTSKEASTDFLKSDAIFQKLVTQETKAEQARDKVSNTIGLRDVKRDELLLDFGDVLVGAKLGERTNPFKKFSKHTPYAMTRLPHAAETKAVRDLTDAVLAKEPPANVVRAITALLKANDAVDEATSALDIPSRALDTAFAARNAHLPVWQKALSSLRVQMKAALANQPGAYAALFAPPEVSERPAPKKKAKKPKQPAA
jgi:hypothetical protein